MFQLGSQCNNSIRSDKEWDEMKENNPEVVCAK